MLLALKIPAWLVNIWTLYGDNIVPIIAPLTMAIVTAIALKIKTDAKVNSAKADLQLEALKNVANREDNKPELERQASEIRELKRAIGYQSEMIDLAFQNSNLDPEIKSNLKSISNKIKYGTEEDLVKELETSNAQLTEQVQALQAQLAERTLDKPVETKKRERR